MESKKTNLHSYSHALIKASVFYLCLKNKMYGMAVICSIVHIDFELRNYSMETKTCTDWYFNHGHSVTY